MRSMEPGQSYDVEIAIPSDHTRGTYWYHPHHHGGADIQMASGMVGALIIEAIRRCAGDRARPGAPLAGTGGVRRLVMVEDFSTLFPETATRFFSINGQRMPTIGCVRARCIAGACCTPAIRTPFAWRSNASAARDCLRRHRPAPVRRRRAAPGSGPRADVLVQAGAPGNLCAGGPASRSGLSRSHRADGRVVVAGAPQPMSLPATLPPAPADDPRRELTGRRTCSSGPPRRRSTQPGTGRSSASWSMVAFRSPSDRSACPLGAVEEWTVNSDVHDDHVFHIHINPFQVTKINGQPGPSRLGAIPRSCRARAGSTVIRSRFLDYTGTFMLHCHMMNHEEIGMMQTVEVYKD